MLVFNCSTCTTPLSADDDQAGQLVRCPTCQTTIRVPGGAKSSTAAVTAGAGAAVGSSSRRIPGPPPPPPPPRTTAAPPSMSAFRPTGKRFGFNCGYCSSRLEATESQSAQEGQCPTCGNAIVIPILDRYGRLIDPRTNQIIKQDPHPVHAYAAAGERAPKILRRKDNIQVIQCPRCQAVSPISANNCKSCGMPFTMEGTTIEASGTSNGFCVASLVLGIISLPCFFTFITPILAIVFGIIGYNQVVRAGDAGSGKGMAIAGIVCGAIGGLMALFMMNRM